jgi:hypothetical protein
MIEQGLLALIANDSGVQASPSSSQSKVGQHVYWVLAPKSQAVPYIVLSRAATKDSYEMTGQAGVREGVFQVDCYASGAGNIGFYESRAIAKAVRNLLENFTGELPDGDSTVLQAVFTDKEWDLPYTEGAKGFVFRSLLHFRVHFEEA